MNRLDKIIVRLNFKKIAVWYLVLAVLTGLICIGTVGWLYRERLNFAYRYSRLEEARSDTELRAAADKTASSSDDTVDVLILNSDNKIVYSAKNSKFGSGTLKFKKIGNEKKYLASDAHPDAVFKYVRGEEFMLNAVFSEDFGNIRSDYSFDSEFESALSGKTVYMLGRVTARNNQRVYVIALPTAVKGGMTALKITASLAMLFFCVYWVLIALWIYADAAKCRLSALYWGFIGLFTNIIGLIVYRIYKRSMTICDNCGAAQSNNSLYCSFCGAAIGERCKSCGRRIEERDNFCCHCGSKIK